MPALLPTGFFSSLTIQASILNSGQCVFGAIDSAKLSEPSSCRPLCHSANPSQIDLLAEPLPKRESIDSSLSLRFRPAALLAARLNAANTEALLANPAATGKFDSDTILALSLMPAMLRMRSMCPIISFSSFLSSSSFIVIVSLSKYPNSTVVFECSPSHVIEMLLLNGRMRSLLRFPQYFISAMLALAMAVALMRLSWIESLKEFYR